MGVGGYAPSFSRSDDELDDLAPGTFQLSGDWPWPGLTAVLKAWSNQGQVSACMAPADHCLPRSWRGQLRYYAHLYGAVGHL